MFTHQHCVLSELEGALLPKFAEASRQELPVKKPVKGKPQMSVGMLTKLWADWVFRIQVTIKIYKHDVSQFGQTSYNLRQ